MPTQERILFVDDEPNILSTFRRNLHNKFLVDIAVGPEEGLAAIRTKGPYAVVVSDLKMPGMDGITFLERVRDIHPDSIRIILSGQGDFDAALQAVNRGAVFRFLTKPCPQETLITVLKEAFRQYRLVNTERELLRGTLLGSVKVLVDVLALVSPEAFGRSERIRDLVGKLGRKLKEPNLWQLNIAAMLCQLGCVGLPEDLMAKVMREEQLGPEELQIYRMHPDIGASLLSNIPRLEGVRELISRQMEDYTPKTPMGARIIRTALDYDRVCQTGQSPVQAVATLSKRNTEHKYDPVVLEALRSLVAEHAATETRTLRLEHLESGMIMAQDLANADGTVLLQQGQRLTDNSIKLMTALSDLLQLRGPFKVLVPASAAR